MLLTVDAAAYCTGFGISLASCLVKNSQRWCYEFAENDNLKIAFLLCLAKILSRLRNQRLAQIFQPPDLL